MYTYCTNDQHQPKLPHSLNISFISPPLSQICKKEREREGGGEREREREYTVTGVA